MKTYRITIPAFTEDIEAENEEEAVERFLFDVDMAQQEPDFTQPLVREIKRSLSRKQSKPTSP